MDQEYKPIITEEERAARRAKRAENRRLKRREKRMRLLRRLIPCLLLVILAGSLLTAGAKFLSPAAPGIAKLSRPAPAAAAASAALEPYSRAEADEHTVQLGETFSSGYAILIDLDTRTILAEKNADAVIDPASMTKIMTVLLGVENLPDLEEIDPSVRKGMEFLPMETIDQVLEQALALPEKPETHRSMDPSVVLVKNPVPAENATMQQ